MTIIELRNALDCLLANGVSSDLPVWIRIRVDDDRHDVAPIDDVQANEHAAVLDGEPVEEDGPPGSEADASGLDVYWRDEAA
jgi:hypothetical protein